MIVSVSLDPSSIVLTILIILFLFPFSVTILSDLLSETTPSGGTSSSSTLLFLGGGVDSTTGFCFKTTFLGFKVLPPAPPTGLAFGAGFEIEPLEFINP